MMRLYVGIDLHSNNCVLVILDERDRVVRERRLRNDLSSILVELAPYRESIQAVAVESTFNWYWLVDGLMENSYRVHLANPAAIQQYKGLKRVDDQRSALWLANFLTQVPD